MDTTAQQPKGEASQQVIESEAYLDEKLPPLTPKQMKFVEGRLNGLSASDAYRAAYDVAGMNPNTLWSSASRLNTDPKVAAWLSAARKAHLGSAVVTQDSHLRELERLREIALDAGDIKGAVGAEIHRGKVAGLYVERSEHIINNPAAILAEIANIDPVVAKRLAGRYAIPLIGASINDTEDAEIIEAEQA